MAPQYRGWRARGVRVGYFYGGLFDCSLRTTMELLGGFRLEHRLDSGGDFAFFRARRAPTPYRDDGEEVVVLRVRLEAGEKRWPPWADPAVATLLRHPGIVELLEEGVVGQFRYFVFEHMDGGDLRGLLRQSGASS